MTREPRALTGRDLVLSHFSLARHHPLPDRIDAAAAGGFAGIGVYLGDYRRMLDSGTTADDLLDQLGGAGVCLAEIEVLTWAVTVSVPAEPVAPAGEAPPPVDAPPAGTRIIVDPESLETVEVPVWARDALSPGAVVRGPALIVEAQTATFVTRRFSAGIASNGSIVMDRLGEDGA